MGTRFYPGWEAGLELEMAQRGAVTRLTRSRHWGPLRVQRPFYPGDCGECHLYLLHPPGGMVTGDVLDVDIDLAEKAGGLITTPSAGKIYRGNTSAVSQRQRVVVRQGSASCLEWLPLETIVFDGARGDLSLRVDMAADSACGLWDIVCLGRPAAGEGFSYGYLRQRVELYLDGKPVYVESNHFDGGSELLTQPWGLAARTVAGTFIAAGDVSAVDMGHLRGLLPEDELISVSCMDQVLAMRYLGNSAEECRRYFGAAWRYLKPLLMSRPFVEPRIWAT